jgi:DnaJ-class molecular chaperone
MEKNFYEILEVRTDASPEVIKAAYKILAQKNHPDKNPSTDSQEFMKLVNKAYTVLSNPQDKLIYDLYINQQKINEKNKIEERIRIEEQKKMANKEKFLKKQYEDLLAQKNKENEHFKNQILRKNKEESRTPPTQQPTVYPQELVKLFEQASLQQQQNNELYQQQLYQRRKHNKVKLIFGLIVYGSTLFIMADFLLGFTGFSYKNFIAQKINSFSTNMKEINNNKHSPIIQQNSYRS